MTREDLDSFARDLKAFGFKNVLCFPGVDDKATHMLRIENAVFLWQSGGGYMGCKLVADDWPGAD